MHAIRLVCLAVAGLGLSALSGCASHSGYSIDVRNNTSERVKLEMTSQTKDGEPKVVATTYVEGGASKTSFTKVERNAMVQLAARVDGDTVSDPALKRLILGKTDLAINPAPNRENLPPKAPKLVIRERND